MTHTDDMGVNCPACGVPITGANWGGYEKYCTPCMIKVKSLIDAQALIVSWLQECGVSQVVIAAKPEYNRYAKTSANGGGEVFYRFERLEDLKELAKQGMDKS